MISTYMFLNEDHMHYFNEFTKRDNTKEEDKERLALFYVLSSDFKYINNIDAIYDFEMHWIEPEVFEKMYFSSTEKRMLAFAFGIYRTANEYDLDVFSLLANCDRGREKVFLYALRIRFDIELVVNPNKNNIDAYL